MTQDSSTATATAITPTGYGKVIVLGEHAVVWGYPALAAALDVGVSARFVPRGDDTALQCAAWALRLPHGQPHPVLAARDAIAATLGLAAADFDHFTIVCDAALPAGAGLGSSAALCVALARLFAEQAKISQRAHAICTAANAGERTFHENPSGVDVALAFHRGVGWFTKADGFRPLHLPRLPIVIGATGQPRNTKQMVQQVARAVDNNRQDPRLVELGELAAAGHLAWQASAWPTLGQLMNTAQAQLASLGVASQRISQLCAAAMAAGAWGVKLTGAGGGGSVIAIGPDVAAITHAWAALAASPMVATLGLGTNPASE